MNIAKWWSQQENIAKLLRNLWPPVCLRSKVAQLDFIRKCSYKALNQQPERSSNEEWSITVVSRDVAVIYVAVPCVSGSDGVAQY